MARVSQRTHIVTSFAGCGTDVVCLFVGLILFDIPNEEIPPTSRGIMHESFVVPDTPGPGNNGTSFNVSACKALHCGPNLW